MVDWSQILAGAAVLVGVVPMVGAALAGIVEPGNLGNQTPEPDTEPGGRDGE